MKTIITLTLAAVLTAGTFRAVAQTDDPLTALMKRRAQEEQQLGGQPAAADAQVQTLPADATQMETPPAALEPTVESMTIEPSATSGSNTNGILLNFRNAPLETVLRYLSDAAGFHIVLETTVGGNVTVISSHPMTKDEAVDLLNAVLNKNGLAAMRNEQFLTILRQSDVRGRNIRVKIWDNDPASIPNNAEIVTQIIPIRFVEAAQLMRDLSPFVSSTATIIANEAGNSIVITDTQANIRHLTEIIKAIDSSAEGEIQVRVFPLKFANPTDVATLLGGIFPTDSSGSQNPISFRGGGGRGGGNPFAALLGGGQGNNASSSQNRIKKQTQVIAVADARTQSVVVTASKDLMEQIDGMIKELDIPSEKDQIVSSVPIKNVDPYVLLQALQSTFPASTTARSGNTTSSSQNSALERRAAANATSQGNSSTTTLGTSARGGGGTRGVIGGN